MSPAIAVRGLCKDYGLVRAVDALSFEVREGEIFALLGPNGAGKTTTIEILEGHRTRTTGQVKVLGVDPQQGGRRYRERIGIMLQAGGIDAELTVAETVRLYASFYRRPRPVDDTIALVGLAEHASRRVRALSGGMRRRLDLGLALIGDPEVIFLDEPTTGFDPTARRAAWDMVAGLRALGKTMLLTSHYMDEVERLADRVAVLRRGRIVAEASPRKLGGRDIAEVVISVRIPHPGWDDELPSGPWTAARDRGTLLLRTDQPTEALAILTSWAVGRGEELTGLTVTRPSLEEAYLQITQPRPSGDTVTAAPVARSRFGLLLAAGQVRYQLLLLLRSPIGTFTALIIPLMVLVALNVATPQVAPREFGGVRYADFLAPAMATFAVLNACYVNTITSVVLAREEGVLKRLHGTPLPLWAYVVGRISAAVLVGITSVAVVLAVGALFMDVHLDGPDIAELAGVIGLGILSFTSVGLAVSTLVPRPDTALPVAYGTMLPFAFISDVFFPASAAPDWLRHTAAVFPLSPIAKATEHIFISGGGWPMSHTQLVVVLTWTAGAALLTMLAFRWQPGASILRTHLRRASRHA